jgi:hypothetical protein
VLRTPEWTIYELPEATPVLTGPGPSELSLLGHDRIEGLVATAGRYLLRVRYTPYLGVDQGDVCLEEAPGGMTELVARSPGTFVLAVPGSGELLRIAFGERPAAC